MFSFRAG
jgi:hypothetical protein